MIEETAQVIASEDGFALVETQRQSACGACSANKGCGTATLSKVLGQKRTQMRVLDPVGSHPGDWVVLGLEEGAMLQGSALIYLTPILSLMIGAGLVTFTQPAHEWPVILGGLTGLLLGLVTLKHYLRHSATDKRYQPVILRRLKAVSSSHDGVFPA